MIRRLALLLLACVFGLGLSVVTASIASAVDCVATPDDPACATTSPSPSADPTTSPSPSESSTPVTDPSPTVTVTAAPSGPDCSDAQPCSVVYASDEGWQDFLTAMGICVVLLLFLVSTHVVGSWRR